MAEGGEVGSIFLVYKIMTLGRVFYPDPFTRSGILKSTRATRRAIGIFRNPSGLRGMWGKILPQKSDFTIQITPKLYPTLQPLGGHAQQMCGLIHLKSLQENIF